MSGDNNNSSHLYSMSINNHSQNMQLTSSCLAPASTIMSADFADIVSQETNTKHQQQQMMKQKSNNMSDSMHNRKVFNNQKPPNNLNICSSPDQQAQCVQQQLQFAKQTQYNNDTNYQKNHEQQINGLSNTMNLSNMEPQHIGQVQKSISTNIQGGKREMPLNFTQSQNQHLSPNNYSNLESNQIYANGQKSQMNYGSRSSEFQRGQIGPKMMPNQTSKSNGKGGETNNSFNNRQTNASIKYQSFVGKSSTAASVTNRLYQYPNQVSQTNSHVTTGSQQLSSKYSFSHKHNTHHNLSPNSPNTTQCKKTPQTSRVGVSGSGRLPASGLTPNNLNHSAFQNTTGSGHQLLSQQNNRSKDNCIQKVQITGTNNANLKAPQKICSGQTHRSSGAVYGDFSSSCNDSKKYSTTQRVAGLSQTIVADHSQKRQQNGSSVTFGDSKSAASQHHQGNIPTFASTTALDLENLNSSIQYMISQLNTSCSKQKLLNNEAYAQLKVQQQRLQQEHNHKREKQMRDTIDSQKSSSNTHRSTSNGFVYSARGPTSISTTSGRHQKAGQHTSNLHIIEENQTYMPHETLISPPSHSSNRLSKTANQPSRATNSSNFSTAQQKQIGFAPHKTERGGKTAGRVMMNGGSQMSPQHLVASPTEQSTQANFLSDYKNFIQKQKKMVSQLSQNKLNYQNYQQLTSNTPKPSNTSLIGMGTGVAYASGALSGGDPSKHQYMDTIPEKAFSNDSRYKYDQSKSTLKTTPKNVTSARGYSNSKLLQQTSNRKSVAKANIETSRKSTTSVTYTATSQPIHRKDFIQENKRLSSGANHNNPNTLAVQQRKQGVTNQYQLLNSQRDGQRSIKNLGGPSTQPSQQRKFGKESVIFNQKSSNITGTTPSTNISKTPRVTQNGATTTLNTSAFNTVVAQTSKSGKSAQRPGKSMLDDGTNKHSSSRGKLVNKQTNLNQTLNVCKQRKSQEKQKHGLGQPNTHRGERLNVMNQTDLLSSQKQIRKSHEKKQQQHKNGVKTLETSASQKQIGGGMHKSNVIVKDAHQTIQPQGMNEFFKALQHHNHILQNTAAELLTFAPSTVNKAHENMQKLSNDERNSKDQLALCKQTESSSLMLKIPQGAKRDEISNILINSRQSNQQYSSGGHVNTTTNGSPPKAKQVSSGVHSKNTHSDVTSQPTNLFNVIPPVKQTSIKSVAQPQVAIQQQSHRSPHKSKRQDKENMTRTGEQQSKTQANVLQQTQAQNIMQQQNQNQNTQKEKPSQSQQPGCTNKSTNLDDTMIFSDKNSLDDYIIGKQIGQGAYAVVRIGLHKPTNQKVALKIYKKYKLEEPNRRRSVKREIKLMEKMKNQHIVQLYEVIDTQKYVILVMEYVGGGSLHGYLKQKSKRRLDEDDAKRIFKQILEGLKYCHSRCITHRDIKLENLLLDENNNIKIIDFGFSTCIPNEKKIKIFCGTPSYMAPEIVLKTEYCGPPADIWALGVLLFTILSGSFPYRGATDEELYNKICKADYHLPSEIRNTLSSDSIDMLCKLFSIKAEDRPNAKQLLAHPWLQSIKAPPPIIEQSKQSSSSSTNQTYEYFQNQKRSKSQKMDGGSFGQSQTPVGANVGQKVTGYQNLSFRKQESELVQKTNPQPEPYHHPAPISRSNSHVIGSQSSSAHPPALHRDNSTRHISPINQRIVSNIVNKLGYSNEEVLYYLQQKDTAESSFVVNLYNKLLREEYERDKSLSSTTNANGVVPKFNQNVNVLSQNSLGMSAGNMGHSQGLGLGNTLQNLGIQASFIPSFKSFNSQGTQNLSNNLGGLVNNSNKSNNYCFNNTQPLIIKNQDSNTAGVTCGGVTTNSGQSATHMMLSSSQNFSNSSKSKLNLHQLQYNLQGTTSQTPHGQGSSNSNGAFSIAFGLQQSVNKNTRNQDRILPSSTGPTVGHNQREQVDGLQTNNYQTMLNQSYNKPSFINTNSQGNNTFIANSHKTLAINTGDYRELSLSQVGAAAATNGTFVSSTAISGRTISHPLTTQHINQQCSSKVMFNNFLSESGGGHGPHDTNRQNTNQYSCKNLMQADLQKKNEMMQESPEFLNNKNSKLQNQQKNYGISQRMQRY